MSMMIDCIGSYLSSWRVLMDPSKSPIDRQIDSYGLKNNLKMNSGIAHTMDGAIPLSNLDDPSDVPDRYN